MEVAIVEVIVGRSVDVVDVEGVDGIFVVEVEDRRSGRRRSGRLPSRHCRGSLGGGVDIAIKLAVDEVVAARGGGVGRMWSEVVRHESGALW